MSYWYLAINNKSEGPLTPDEIINRIRAGQVNPQTLAYTQGMSDWTPLGQIPQFHSLFKGGSEAPPPVPTSAANWRGAMKSTTRFSATICNSSRSHWILTRQSSPKPVG